MSLPATTPSARMQHADVVTITPGLSNLHPARLSPSSWAVAQLWLQRHFFFRPQGTNSDTPHTFALSHTATCTTGLLQRRTYVEQRLYDQHC